MKVAFYIKLFFAFLLFAALLMGLFFFLSKNFYQKHYEELSSKTFVESIAYRKRIFKERLTLNNQRLKSIVNSRAYQKYVQNNNPDELLNMFTIIKDSDSQVLEISVLNGYAKRVVGTTTSHKKGVSDESVNVSFTQEEFFELLKLPDQNIWHSEFLLNIKKAEIEYPLQPVLKFVIKMNNHYILLVLDARSFINETFNLKNYKTYIISSSGDFVLHANSEYNWSQYFYPKITLEKEFVSDYKNILRFNHLLTKNLISSKVPIDKNRFFIVLVEFDKKITNKFKDSNYVIAIISILITVILALIFTNPISNLNRKLEVEKESLNLSIVQNSDLLDDSLKLIDKYVMYIKFDIHKVILDVSSYYCEISGFDKEELLGQPYTILLHEDTNFEEIFKEISHGRQYKGEVKNVKKFGGIYWGKSNFEALYDEHKNIVAFTEIRNNITNTKKIQKLYLDLNNQIEQLNAIFQNANSGIALLDYEGNLENANVAFCNLLGYNNDNLVGKNIFSYVLKNRKEFFQLMLEQAKEFGVMSNIEIVFLCKNQDYVHLNVSFSILPDKDHVVLVANSLEDKRKLQELNQNLEQKVKEEVAKNIEQEKIYQEEQIKNAKLTSIGTLAAGITHEINTPLTYLKGNFEMMQYDIDDLPQSRQKQNMQNDSEKIIEAINRIANIVESMREMSQSSSEAKDRTNIYATLVTSLTMAYNRSKQISKIYLNDKLFEINSINKHEYEFFANVQKQRVEQVWVIIVNNALDELHKISDYEQRELHINVCLQKDEVVISFKDNAGGINEQMLQNIFEPFISSKEHSGMGIGLNIAKKIVDEQDGVIHAFNENGGAVFEIRFKSLK